MRTTVTLDDELVEDIEHYTGIDNRSEAIREALKKFVQYEAGKRLALLGGTMPGFEPAPRRRPPDFTNPE